MKNTKKHRKHDKHAQHAKSKKQQEYAKYVEKHEVQLCRANKIYLKFFPIFMTPHQRPYLKVDFLLKNVRFNFSKIHRTTPPTLIKS